MPRLRMRAEDDRIPRLDRHDAFEQDCRGGVRDRSKREDDADRFGHLDQVAFRNLANHADGALIFDVVVDELGGHHVLDDLVFHHSEFGFFDRQARQMLRLLQPGQHHRLDDAIDILLRELGEDSGSGSGLADETFEVCDAFRTDTFHVERNFDTLFYNFTDSHRYLLHLCAEPTPGRAFPLIRRTSG